MPAFPIIVRWAPYEERLRLHLDKKGLPGFKNPAGLIASSGGLMPFARIIGFYRQLLKAKFKNPCGLRFGPVQEVTKAQLFSRKVA
jgi:hypothetical protein